MKILIVGLNDPAMCNITNNALIRVLREADYEVMFTDITDRARKIIADGYVVWSSVAALRFLREVPAADRAKYLYLYYSTTEPTAPTGMHQIKVDRDTLVANLVAMINDALKQDQDI